MFMKLFLQYYETPNNTSKVKKARIRSFQLYIFVLYLHVGRPVVAQGHKLASVNSKFWVTSLFTIFNCFYINEFFC